MVLNWDGIMAMGHVSYIMGSSLIGDLLGCNWTPVYKQLSEKKRLGIVTVMAMKIS